MHALQPTKNGMSAHQWEWKSDEPARSEQKGREPARAKIASITSPSLLSPGPASRPSDQGLAIDRLIDELDQAFGGEGFIEPERTKADIADTALPMFEGEIEEQEGPRVQEVSEIDGQPLIFADEYASLPNVSAKWPPEPGFWRVDERAGAKVLPDRYANRNVRYYVGGAATLLLVGAGAAFLALQSTRDAAVSNPAVDPTSPAPAAAVADRQPPAAAPAAHPTVAAPAIDEINARESNRLDRLTILPEYAALPDEPVAGDPRVEAGEPLGRGPAAENLGNQGIADAMAPGSPLPFPAATAEALAAADAAPKEGDAPVLVETTTIPVTTPATTAAWVNLRAGPDNGADVIAVIEAGAALEVIECNRWCNVIADGTHGWIHRNFIDGDMLPERAEPAAGAANVRPFTATATEWLSVYDSPFEGGRVATSIRAGSDIFIVGCDVNWCETRLGPDNRRGWVDRRLVGMPEDMTEGQIPPLPPITRDEAAAL